MLKLMLLNYLLGLIGEVKEAFKELELANINLTKQNIIKYLSAKAQLIKYYNSSGKDVAIICEKYMDDLAGGSLTPEWVLALATILTIISHSLNIAEKLNKLLNKTVEKRDEEKINIKSEEIIKIKEVIELNYVSSKLVKEKVNRQRSVQRKTKKSLRQT